MTTETLPVAQIAARSREVSFSRVAATVITAIFVVIGWALGAGWRLTVFLTLLAWHRGLVYGALSVRYGILRGRGLTDAQILARQTAEPAPAEAAPPGRP